MKRKPKQLDMSRYFGEGGLSLEQKVAQDSKPDVERIPAREEPEAQHPDKQEICINLNSVPPYGIRRKDLQKLGYYNLESIFYGMHSTELPQEMLAAMNPAQILAAYMAADDYKRSGILDLGNAIESGNFIYTVSSMVMWASKILSFCHAATEMNRAYPTGLGEMQDRLKRLPEEVKDSFLAALKKPRPYSDKERPQDFDFHDPNVDGQSKTLYINSIFKMLCAR